MCNPDTKQYDGITYMPCTPDNGFYPDISVAKDCDILMFCNPNNPTGACATKAQLTELVNFCRTNGQILVFDSAYSAIPTAMPTTAISTAVPTAIPTVMPTTAIPTAVPTAMPTKIPTQQPTMATSEPTTQPTAVPTTAEPTPTPTFTPATTAPTAVPTIAVTNVPTNKPQHPCDNPATNNCASADNGGLCVKDGSDYVCQCADGFGCVSGCGNSIESNAQDLTGLIPMRRLIGAAQKTHICQPRPTLRP